MSFKFECKITLISVFNLYISSFFLKLLSSLIKPTFLQERIENIISSIPRENVAIYIKSQNPNNESSFDNLFALNAFKYMIPASNNKVLTTAAAYLKFGGNSQLFSTNFYGNVENGILRHLCVVASGKIFDYK